MKVDHHEDPSHGLDYPNTAPAAIRPSQMRLFYDYFLMYEVDSFSTSTGNQQMCDKLETGQVDRHEKCAFI